MADSQEKGSFQANIPADAVEEALRSVERVRAGGEPEPERGAPDEVAPDEVALSVEPGDAGPSAEGEGDAPDPQRAELESLRAQLELSQTKGRETLDRLKDQHERFLRAAADLENFRKRAQRERDDVQKFGIEKVVKDLLPAVDGLDRALAAAPEGPLGDGVRLVRAALEQALAKHGVKGFSALGQRFDPALHEALLQVPTADAAPGTVVLEHARGFMLHDRLVRPAMVGVSTAPLPPAEGGAANEG
jgi:molecular chaperone GrpE